MHVPYMSYVPYVTYLNVGQAFENLGARVQGRPILYKLFPAHICGCGCVCMCVCLCVVSECVYVCTRHSQYAPFPRARCIANVLLTCC
jgi:hypothetical protein